MSVLNSIAQADNVHDEDIIHRAMKLQIGLLPVVLLWGLTMETLRAFAIVRIFDLASCFTAVLAYEGGVAALLTSGTAALFFRKTSNADGSNTVEESVTKGPQPSVNNTTVLVQP